MDSSERGWRMRLREILDRPDLGLALLAGGDGDLDRPVLRVYTTDLLDPGRYLSGGELVLTGLMWRRTSADSEAFAANLAGLGVTAVGAGEAALGEVPADLVEACRRHRLVLFRVPVDVSFRVITDEVSRSAWSERAGGLASSLGRHRGLVSAMARGARLADLLPAVAAELGVSCWVRSATGRIIAGTGPPPETDGDELARAFLTAGTFPHQVRIGGRTFQLLAVTGRPGHRLASWCLVLDVGSGAAGADAGTGAAGTGAAGTGAAAPPLPPPHEQPATTDELLHLVALERATLDQGRDVEQRLTGRLVRLLTGAAEPSEPSELRAALQACGLSADAAFLVVAATLTTAVGSAVAAETTVHLLEELLRPLSPRIAVGEASGGAAEVAMGVVTVEPERAGELIEALRSDARSVGSSLGGGRLAIGVSERAAGPAELPVAAEHARHALRTAAGGAAPAEVVCSADLASHLLLLAGVGAEARRSFQARMLGPLEDYDRAHHADLVHTLRTFLACSGSWNRSAQELHVHVNTLRYRLQRIEHLTGRDLSRFEDRVDFFLALRLASL